MRSGRRHTVLVWTIVWAVAAVVTLQSLAGEQAGEAYLLRYEFPPGGVQVSDVTVTQTDLGGAQEQGLEIQSTSLAHVRDTAEGVARIDDYGLTLDLTVRRGEAIVFESHGGPEGDWPADDPRGKCHTHRQDARGQTLETTRPLDADPAAAVMTEIDKLLSVLPQEAVRVGDTWTQHRTIQAGGATVTITCDARLDRVGTRDGALVAIVSSRATAECGGAPAGAELAGLTCTQTGDLVLDVDRGAALSASYELDVNATVAWGEAEPRRLHREGKTEVVFRSATDAELAQAVALTFANVFRRRDPDMLDGVMSDTVMADPDGPYQRFRQNLDALFRATRATDAYYADLEHDLDAETPTVQFGIVVSAAPQGEESEMAPIRAVRLELRVARLGDFLRVTALSLSEP